MAYDPRRDVIVLYGGATCVAGGCPSQTTLADLWEWDGSRWTQITLAEPTPGPRSRHAMVYDAEREQVVLIGSDGGMFGWDGETWESITGYCNDGCPLSRVGHALAYHAGWDRPVLFSGFGGAAGDIAPILRNDSYQLDGEYWRPLPSSGQHPEGRTGSDLVYDPDRNVMWLFAGILGNDRYPNELWKLDDSGWHREIASGSPDSTTPWGRQNGAFVWHAGLGKAVLMGGWNHEAIASLGLQASSTLSLWLWDGDTWENKADWFLQVAVRHRHAAVYVPTTKSIFQFGGMNMGGIPTSSTFVLEPQ